MHMWYWFGHDLGCFLFPGLNVTTTGGFISICFALVSLALLYEGMKISQIKLRRLTRSFKSRELKNSENSSLLSKISPRSFKTSTSRECSYWIKWFVEIMHWSLHTTLSYLLMLSVMTYNGYISIVLIIGSGLGYWIFGPVLIEFNITQIQQKQKFIKCNVECSDAITNSERRASKVSVIAEQLMAEVNVDSDAPHEH